MIWSCFAHLTHWCLVTHSCAIELVPFAPIHHITNKCLLWIGPRRANCSQENEIENVICKMAAILLWHHLANCPQHPRIRSKWAPQRCMQGPLLSEARLRRVLYSYLIEAPATAPLRTTNYLQMTIVIPNRNIAYKSGYLSLQQPRDYEFECWNRSCS